jgi:hypothetical protein
MPPTAFSRGPARIPKAQTRDHILRRFRRLGAPHAVDLRDQFQVLPHAQLLRHRRFLRGYVDARAHASGLRVMLSPETSASPAVGGSDS